MKDFIDKKKIVTTAVLLLFAVSAVVATLPTAFAHYPPLELPTWAYISASPSTVGVGQPITIVMWLNDYPYTAVGAYGDRWDGFTVDVTKPDGSTTTLGPFTSDPVGSAYSLYTPDQTGTYTFLFKFPGDTLTGEPVPPGGYYAAGASYINDTYLPSQSDPVQVVVQSTPIAGYDETPLPNGYWTRPIHGANRQWGAVSGNWLGLAVFGHNFGRINDYSRGPSTAHIMWTRQYWAGGIMGGKSGDIPYYDGMSYETFGLAPPIILNGRLYYNVQTPPRYGWYAIDLRTGEELYFHNTTGPIAGTSNKYPASGADFDWSGSLVGDTLNFGQVLDIELPNQHGGFPYLWSTGQMGSQFGGTGPSTTWRMFDAFTGNYICSIANVSMAGTQVVGTDGSILYYSIGTPANRRLTVWNTTQAIWYRTSYVSNQYWMWRPYLNVTFNGNYGFSLNVSIPSVQGAIYEIVPGQQIIGGTSGKRNSTFTMDGNLWALSLKPGEEGKLLWNKTFTPPETIVDDAVGGIFGYGKMTGPQVDSANGVFLFSESITRNRWAYDLDTMQQLWKSAEPEAQWQFYGMSTSIYEGKLLSYGYGGVLIAYDIRTGNVLWKWASGTVGFEGYYENTPLSLGAIADDKIYLYSSEHSPSKPLRRDANLWCIDLNEGKLLWKLQHWGTNPAIADGYLVDLDTFDNQIYCFGKGPSATTVATSPAATSKGNVVLVQGTVTDQSAGAKGTPAIADADQEVWMEYLYQQRPKPTNAKGVQVTLTAVDQSGGSQNIGTALSDDNGNFGFSWTPQAEGTYKIVASFAGSGAYSSSEATTYLAVSSAPSGSPQPSTAPPPNGGAPDATWIAVAAVVIIIIVIAAAVLLRRRK